MAIRVRVNAVIKDWCGQPAPQDQNLQQLWEATRNDPNRPHDGVAFQRGGVNTLIDKLADEFKKPGVESRRIVMQPDDFEPSGGVKTIDDVVTAVVFSPDGAAAGATN